MALPDHVPDAPFTVTVFFETGLKPQNHSCETIGIAMARAKAYLATPRVNRVTVSVTLTEMRRSDLPAVKGSSNFRWPQ